MSFSKSCSVFVVDNDEKRLNDFKAIFRDWSHFVSCCGSIAEARSLIKAVVPDLILINYQTPLLLEKEFLQFLKENCTSTIRVVFADKKDKGALIRLVAAGLAHRSFTLPWSEDVIRQQLEKDLSMRSRMRMQKCWNFLEQGRGLPHLPEVMAALEATLIDESCTLSKVAKVLQQDPVIAARLLQIVNSPLFNCHGQISSLERAVGMLGLSRVRKIVLFLCSIKHFQYPKVLHGLALKIVQHSLNCAKLAGIVAQDLAPQQVLTVASAGLLHDIGKLAFLAAIHEKKDAINDIREKYNLYATEVEEQLFGISHQELGSSMLLWWNLPLSIVDAAMNHSQPLNSLSGVTQCVAIADKCLAKAQSGSKLTTDLGMLSADFPVEKWLKVAHTMLSEDIMSIAA